MADGEAVLCPYRFGQNGRGKSDLTEIVCNVVTETVLMQYNSIHDLLSMRDHERERKRRRERERE